MHTHTYIHTYAQYTVLELFPENSRHCSIVFRHSGLSKRTRSCRLFIRILNSLIFLYECLWFFFFFFFRSVCGLSWVPFLCGFCLKCDEPFRSTHSDPFQFGKFISSYSLFIAFIPGWLVPSSGTPVTIRPEPYCHRLPSVAVLSLGLAERLEIRPSMPPM